MKLTRLLLLASFTAAVVWLALTRTAGSARVTHSLHSVAVLAGHGTLIQLRRHTDYVVATIRFDASHLQVIRLRPAARVLTGDGSLMHPAGLRVGDRVYALNDGSVVDSSQTTRTFRGIVASVPTTASDPYIVQTAGAWSVQTDVDARTKYADSSGETVALSQIVEEDVVLIHGVFDSALSELTQTTSVARLGPYLRRPRIGHVQHA